MRTEQKQNLSTGKIIIGIIGLVALGTFIWKVTKEVKKTKKEEAKEEQELQDLGVNTQELNQTSEIDSGNMPKKLMRALATGDPVIDDDAMDAILALNACNTVHIFQRKASEVYLKGNFRGCHNKHFLEIVFELPDYVKNNNKRKIGIREYKRAFKEMAEKITSEFIKISPMESRLCGYLLADVTRNGVVRDTCIQLKDWCYREFDQDKHGLTEMYRHVQLNDNFGPATEAILEFLNQEFAGTESVKPTQMFLGYRILFPIAELVNPIGVSLSQLIKVIDYVINEFEISENGASLTYDHIIFHAPEDNGVYSWEKFYDLDDNRRITVTDLNDLPQDTDE